MESQEVKGYEKGDSHTMYREKGYGGARDSSRGRSSSRNPGLSMPMVHDLPFRPN